MHRNALGPLALRDLKDAPLRSILLLAGIAFGITGLCLILALGAGIQRYLLPMLGESLPIDMIEVQPRTLDFGLMRIDTAKLLGTGQLDASSLQTLAAIPGIVAAYPRLEIPILMSARGGMELFGKHLATDVFLNGLPAELLSKEVGPAILQDDGPMPVVLSDSLLEIYNHSLAPTIGTPAIAAAVLYGLEFDIIMGRSAIQQQSPTTRQQVVRAKIVGSSAYAKKFGLSVTLDTARRLQQQFAPELGGTEQYSSILLRLADPKQLGNVIDHIERLGFGVHQSAQQARKLLRFAMLIAIAMSCLVLLLSASNIAHSFIATLRSRSKELAVLRSLGAAKHDIIGLLALQAAILGLAGSLAGLLLAKLVAVLAEVLLQQQLRHFALPLQQLFWFRWEDSAVALLAGIVAAIAGSLVATLRITRHSISQSLVD